MISMIETSKLHRNNYQTGREEIYVSHWKVKEDIKMQLIVHRSELLAITSTYCKNLIIANSSFSWGTFLNKNVDKVVAPYPWVNREGKIENYCEEWIKICKTTD